MPRLFGHLSPHASYWLLHRFLKRHSDVRAFTVRVDPAYGTPWVLALFDTRPVALDSAYSVIIASPGMQLGDLPAERRLFQDAGWPTTAGFALSYRHYTGLCVHLHFYPDGSGGFGVSIDRPDGATGEVVNFDLISILDVHVPYSIVQEYVTCLHEHPTRWRQRHGWITNPVPYDPLWVEAGADIDTMFQHESAARDRWLQIFLDATRPRVN